jgi:hypothetical protein
MGHTVDARVYADVVEVRYLGQLIQTMPRLRKEDAHKIDYRHVIGWLVRKPGAFARYRYREDLFPSVTFRRAYDRLLATHGDRADIEYLRLLRLAAKVGEGPVADTITTLLDLPAAFDYAAVEGCVAPPTVTVPLVHIPRPNLRVYDALLTRAVA